MEVQKHKNVKVVLVDAKIVFLKINVFPVTQDSWKVQIVLIAVQTHLSMKISNLFNVKLVIAVAGHVNIYLHIA